MHGEIVTDRLTLRQIPWKKAEALSDSQHDPAVQTGYLKKAFDEHPEILEDTQELARVISKMFNATNGEKVCWGAFLKDEMIGYINIIHPNDDDPVLQYEIREVFQRKGYGFAAVSGVLQTFWKTHPGKPVSALIRPNNFASIALIKKLGGVLMPPQSPLEEMMVSTYKIAAM